MATSIQEAPAEKIAVVIAGPTASGKSAYAVRLAQRVPAEIVNADALQLYADLAILSARPTEAEQGGVPHHLFGYVDAAMAASAARWRADAMPVIGAIWARGRLPVIVGGTGLYLRALLEGLSDVPPIPDAIRSSVRQMPAAARAAALASEDPQMAARLNPHDSQRLARALEVVRATGCSLASFQGRQPDGLAAQARLLCIRLLPERQALYAACDARLDAMMAAGAVAEVQRLAARGLDPALPAMKAVGVPELLALVRGEVTADAALAAAQLSTRHFAKRQFTWFRNQCPDWHTNLLDDELAIKLREMGLTVK